MPQLERLLQDYKCLQKLEAIYMFGRGLEALRVSQPEERITALRVSDRVRFRFRRASQGLESAREHGGHL